jgi:hypothetical protein
MMGITISKKRSRPARRSTGASVERVGHRHPEAAADGEQGDGRAELDVQVGATLGLEVVEEPVDGGTDPLVDPPLRALGHERRLNQHAVAPVLFALHVEHGRLVERCRGFVRVRLRGETLGIAHDEVARLVVERGEVPAIRIREALEDGVAVEADHRPRDALVHGTLLAVRVEDGVRIDVEGAAAGGVDIAAEIEQLAQAGRVELQFAAAAHHFTFSRTTTGMTRVVRLVYSS